MSIRDRLRKYAVPCTATVFIISAFLWVWTSGIYRSLPTPACQIRLPFVMIQSAARENGVHFLAMRNRANQFPEIHFRKVSHFGSAGYHFAFDVNILSLEFAVLPTRVIDDDYVVNPYVAAVLPYWLLIVLSGYFLVTRTKISKRIQPFCRISLVSSIVAGLILLVFALLNVVPSVEMEIPNNQPRTLAEWINLTIDPKNVFSEVMLEYGYPFPCLRDGIINGQSVTFFYGDTLGWRPHKVMENICAVAIAVLLAVVAVNWSGQYISNKYGRSRSMT